jgi:hypothetical protein
VHILGMYSSLSFSFGVFKGLPLQPFHYSVLLLLYTCLKSAKATSPRPPPPLPRPPPPPSLLVGVYCVCGAFLLACRTVLHGGPLPPPPASTPVPFVPPSVPSARSPSPFALLTILLFFYVTYRPTITHVIFFSLHHQQPDKQFFPLKTVVYPFVKMHWNVLGLAEKSMCVGGSLSILFPVSFSVFGICFVRK